MIIHYKNLFFDTFRLLGKLSPARLLNLVVIYSGFWLSRLTRRVMVLGKPFALSAEVSSLCNLQCPQCPKGMKKTNREGNNLSVDAFGSIAARYRESVFYANLYFQGEPFLNPELPKIVRVASNMGFYTSISTNGHFLDEKTCGEAIEAGLDRLIVSIDGLDQATYSHYRTGGNLLHVVEGVSTMVRVRSQGRFKNPFIVLQFLVNRHNEHQIPALGDFARNLGVDMVQLKSMQVYENTNAKDFLPSNRKYNRYHVLNTEKNTSVNKIGVPCFRLYSHVVFTSDGIAVPCCYDKIPQYPFENKMGENHWFSPELNSFRRKVMYNRKEVGICCNCAE